MKRKTTKELLSDSFRELAEHHSINKITIKDITQNCGLSPATFYRHFKDKYDLITWDYAGQVGSRIALADAQGLSWRQLMLDFARFYDGEREFFKNLLRHTSGYDSFLHNMIAVSEEQVAGILRRAVGDQPLDPELLVYIRMFCYAAVQLICEWLTGALKATPEQIADYLDRGLPTPLAAYFHQNDRIQ